MELKNFNDFQLNESSKTGFIYVMIFKGKNNSVDSVKLNVFASKELANNFIEKTNDRAKKYWTYCQIVDINEEVDIYAGDMQDDSF